MQNSFEVDPLPKSTVTGKLLRNVEPHFPLPISGQAMAGTVVVHMTISPAGMPTNIFTIASSTPRMADAAAEAAKKMVFEPSRLNGEPIELPAILISNFKTTPAP